MDIKPLHSESDYDAALRAIEPYFESEQRQRTDQADRFDLLAQVIADYEVKHWPIEPPDPAEGIEHGRKA